MKKKDKKKYKRKKVNLKNLRYKDLKKAYKEDFSKSSKARRKNKTDEIKTSKINLNLSKGRIKEIFSNYTAEVELEDRNVIATIGGHLKQYKYKNRNLIVVGDFVNVDIKNEEIRIEEVLKRKSKFSRFNDKKIQDEIIFAANIDQIIITSALKNPRLDCGFIDRCLIEAKLLNIKPIICINKIDLLEDETELDDLDYYSDSYEIILTSAEEEIGLKEIKQVLHDKDSVFLGKSGVGKSSLINKLQPGIQLRTGEISEKSGKGAHITTSTKLISWDFGGHLVDSPGVKTMALNRDQKNMIPRLFPGFAKYISECKFNDCTHTHEKKCGVKKAVENLEIPINRFESYLRIYSSL